MAYRETGGRPAPASVVREAGHGPLRDALSHRLLAGILAVGLSLAVVATLVEFGIDYHTELDRLRADLATAERNAAPRLSRALREGDASRIDSELAALLGVSPVHHAQLVASDGRTYEAGRPVLPLRDLLQRTDKLEFFTAEGSRELLGSLRLEASTATLKSRLLERLLLRMVLQTIKMVLLALFILLFFRWLVSRHLAVIALQMRRTTSLNLREPLQLQRPWQDDEIGDLAQAFNLMRRNVQHEIEIRERHDRSVAAEAQVNLLALDSLPQLALRFAPDGMLAWMNAAAERWLGRSLSDAQGRSPGELLPVARGSSGRTPEALFQQAKSVVTPLSSRLQLAESAGGDAMAVFAAAIRDSQGEVLGVLMLLEPLSDGAAGARAAG